MSTFARMLKEVSSSRSHRHTVRKIILLKDRKSYEECLLECKKCGIKPYSQVKSIHMLCCHIDSKDDTWKQLQNHPDVHSIETDIIRESIPVTLKRQVHRKVPWGVERIHAPEVWGCTRGEGVKVAILDSGISPHPDLKIAGGVNIINPKKSFRDDAADHGTLVAGVVGAIGKNRMTFGVAPRARLYAVKIIRKYKGQWGTFTSDIIKGIEWCIRNRMDVINMSFGSPGFSRAEHAIVKQAYRKEIVMVAGVGNDGPINKKGIFFPGRYPEVIAVAATDKRNLIANFSSRGKGINVAAPGVDILSTDNKGGFEVVSGTSFAAPHVTGTVALMLANKPKLSQRPVRKTLMKTAKCLKGFKRTSQGAGLIRANLAVINCKVK